MKKKFHFNTLLMIFAVVVLVAISTWFLPGGEYARVFKDGKNLVDPNSFKFIENSPQGLGEILMAPIKGFIEAAHIIVFLFVIGGAFNIIANTGAITVGIKYLAIKFSREPHLQKFFIPVTMTLFSLGGTIFGMAEETMPFVLIFIPLSMALGYDSIVGTAIPFLGAAAGFAGSVFNPFTVGVAQSIAELKLYSGMEYRIVIWVISTVCMIAFVMMYASKIKKDPTKSLVYEIDKQRAKEFHIDVNEEVVIESKHKSVLFVFVAGMIFLVYGILKFHWYINEIAALFLGLGIISGIVGKLSVDELTNSLKDGAKDMVGVAFIIACAKGILVVARDGKVLDLMLYSFSGAIQGLHPILAAQAMFIVQGIINFFVHSGSGQAALTMPVMAPLADLVGISRQTAVLAFQFGEGWINPILPTSGVTMGVLGLAGIPYEKWFKWMLPAQIFFFILALLLLIPPFLINYN
jgi:uncharacterized ion transporter superfamily protein YfcC